MLIAGKRAGNINACSPSNHDPSSKRSGVPMALLDNEKHGSKKHKSRS
jgi:hypothetical protein